MTTYETLTTVAQLRAALQAGRKVECSSEEKIWTASGSGKGWSDYQLAEVLAIFQYRAPITEPASSVGDAKTLAEIRGWAEAGLYYGKASQMSADDETKDALCQEVLAILDAEQFDDAEERWAEIARNGTVSDWQVEQTDLRKWFALRCLTGESHE